MDLLKLRRIMKSKKPHFIRQDANKRKEIGIAWRRPKGMHSKMRLRKRGHPKHVEIGWRSPISGRGLHRNGLTQMIVRNVHDLEKMDAKKDGVIIARTTGLKARLVLLNAVKEKGFTLLNVKAEKILQQAEARTARKKTEKKAEKPEAKQKKQEKKEEMSDEERKKAEKEEKDKVLTKRDI